MGPGAKVYKTLEGPRQGTAPPHATRALRDQTPPGTDSHPDDAGQDDDNDDASTPDGPKATPTMATLDDKPKEQIEEEAFENAPAPDKLHDEHAQAIMPASLRGMSDDELKTLEKGIVRKIDMVVLYVFPATSFGSSSEQHGCSKQGY